MYKSIYCILLTSGLLSACMQQVGSYNSAEHSGLVSVRPYPQPNGVCQILGESPATVDYLDHSAILIGCPDHDLGAIEDRKTEGAKIVGKVNSWTLLQLPEQQN